MREPLRGWLQPLPISNPVPRQQAALLQGLQIAALLTMSIVIPLNIVIFGPVALTWYGLVPNLLVFSGIAGALALLRRGHFAWSVRIVIGAILAGQAHGLVRTGISGSNGMLLISLVPITLAGLLVGRRALICTIGLSIAIVGGVSFLELAGISIGRLPMSQQTVVPATLSIFLLVLALLGFFLDRFGVEQARGLARLVEERTEQLVQANRSLEAQAQQLVEANRQLQQLSYRDGLTGIANRRQFETLLASAWQRGSRDGGPLSLILLDIDYFKGFNDTYGHPAGDRCLQQVAQRLRVVVGCDTNVVARYGGEEFAILLPMTGEPEARAVAEHLRVAVHTLGIAHAHSAVAAVVTVSLGVATLIPSQTGASADLIAAADAALYRAKRSGRNRYVVAELP